MHGDRIPRRRQALSTPARRDTAPLPQNVFEAIMTYSAKLACFAGCAERYPLDEVIYRCRACGSLLDVEHDFEALAQRSASAWMNLFDRRWMRTEWPYGSGVWGKKEWVYPDIADESIVSFAEGGSNLLWAERYGKSLGLDELWVKQCGNSHTGSFKDLGMTVLVSAVQEMIRRGRPIRAIACASTGDTSAALAAYCAAAGLPALVLLPRDKVSIAQLLQPLANGALVFSLDTDFDGCMKVVQSLAEDGSIYLANSMNSLRIEGQKTVAIEILQQLDWEAPDWIVVPGGNLGNVYALGKGLLGMLRLGLIAKLPRLCVAQAEKANPLYRAFVAGFDKYAPITAGTTLASAIQIGNPVSIERAIRVLGATNGVVEQASEHELSDAVARADRTGMYNDPHTGVALAAVEKLVRAGTIKKNERVVVVSTAHGLKFTEFKRGYHLGALEGVASQYANKPIELAPDVDAVRRAIDERIKETVATKAPRDTP
jgi:threonine synthase